MIERPDPDALMAGPLGTWLAAQQGERDAARAKIAARRKWVIIGTITAALVMLAISDVQGMLWVGAVVGGLGWAWAEAAGKPVRTAIKTQINQSIAKALDLSFSVEAVPGPEFALASRFALVPAHDRTAFEDRWSGNLGAMPFQTYEAELKEWQGSGKERKLRTVFRGALTSVRFARRFHGTTMIERQRSRRKFLIGAEKEEIDLGGVMLQRCDMVDPRFEDEFTVWSSDPVEGRFLVHPEYIERLMAIETAFAANNIRALFCEGELIVVLDTGDMYESGSLVSSDDRTLLARTIDQFGSVAELAHKLNETPRGNFTPAAPA